MLTENKIKEYRDTATWAIKQRELSNNRYSDNLVFPASAMLEIVSHIEAQQKEIERLTYTLIGVMHSVDKWFDEVDESTDEVNRAAQAREIALQEIEKRDEALLMVKEALKSSFVWLMETPEGKNVPQVKGEPGRWAHKAEQALSEIDKVIGVEKDDYPCTDKDCYDRGNFHMGCESCPRYKGGAVE